MVGAQRIDGNQDDVGRRRSGHAEQAERASRMAAANVNPKHLFSQPVRHSEPFAELQVARFLAEVIAPKVAVPKELPEA
jgi:hypothetical protein